MKRTRQHTAWAATFAAAAELSRRGYDVTFTLGNTPRTDLLCAIPDGEQFKVQVKGISNRTAFYAQKDFFEAPMQRDLFLVVVLVPSDEQTEFRFFILTHKEAKKEFDKMPKYKKDGRPYESDFGLNWGSVTPYEGRWNSFPKATK
ncbi:MAG: hypothetical protein HY356_03295 [Gammaproteobacteria bacterium]|nr:hypothetical protein [Gammaproteobacteria bacterium]